MKKILQIVLVVTAVALMSTGAMADVKKGQKIIIKKLKSDCGMNGGEIAKKHTQEEWKSINDSGSLPSTIQEMCPNSQPLKDTFYPHVYDFLYNFASDSGNVPAC